MTRGDDGKEREFRVWGVNYDHDSVGAGRLLEDYWETEWETVVSDFREIRELGANVVRIHLQFGKFMTAPDLANERALGQLTRLLQLAEESGLYLDITGLGCYHKADVPGWYDTMDEAKRWRAQAMFWRAIARACKGSTAVFCFNLMNEPILDGRKEAGWLGGELGGKYFVQRLTLEPGQRSTVEIARAWVEQMTRAIREEDPKRLITVGVIPWAQVWPGAKPIFYSPEVAPMLDFVSVHVYPKSGELDRALHAVAVHQIGKPVVIEETFPLSCSIEEMREFLQRTRDSVAGYVSFYWGRTVEENEAAPAGDLGARLTAVWLREFRAQATRMK